VTDTEAGGPVRGEPPAHAQPARRWLVLSVAAPPFGEEHLLVDALRRMGARAVEREAQRFVAYMPDAADADEVVRHAAAAVRASTSVRDPVITWHREDDAHWVRRRAGDPEPLRVTGRIVIDPVGREPDAAQPGNGEGDVVIRLHPGIAFGTAEHPTTRACLRLLERWVEPGARIADVGAGSGILAIAAALLGAREVTALEIDPLACADMERNLEANVVADRVRVRQGAATHAGLRALGPLDGMVANIEFAVVAELLPAMAAALAPGGWLVVSGIIRPEREALLRAAGWAGLRTAGEEIDEGWWTGWFRAADGG